MQGMHKSLVTRPQTHNEYTFPSVYGARFPEDKLSVARSKVRIVQSVFVVGSQQQPISETFNQVIIHKLSGHPRLQCAICEQTKPAAEFKSITLTCSHKFCQQCIHSYLSYRIVVNDLPIPCPTQDCTELFSQRVPVFQQLPDQLKEKYQKFTRNRQLMLNDNLRPCPTPDCQGALDLQKDPFICPKCNHQFCKVCFLPAHAGNCDSNADDFLRTNFNFKQLLIFINCNSVCICSRKCSKCKMLVQRNQGCSHMTCKCGNQFCYQCGGNWSAKHSCFEYAYLNTPVTPCFRVINYSILPLWIVLGLALWLFVAVSALALSLVIGPFMIGFNISRLPCTSTIVIVLLFFPFLSIASAGVLIYAAIPFRFGLGYYIASIRYLAR